MGGEGMRGWREKGREGKRERRREGREGEGKREEEGEEKKKGEMNAEQAQPIGLVEFFIKTS